jgi:Kef-type K+ transport system membrane component KefB
MGHLIEILYWTTAFVIIAVASNQIAHLFKKIKLPHITGLLIIGIITGPFVLQLVEREAIVKLHFVNETALAFIAFAAGNELYFLELRSRFKSIKWMTFGQLVVTFVLSGFTVYLISPYIPFTASMTTNGKIAVAILVATIFVARSPASAIAVISEVRAKGPFTQTVMGVTVVKDVLVIILFTICFSLATSLTTGQEFNFASIYWLAIDLLLSFALGIGLGKLIALFLSWNLKAVFKIIFVLSIGYSIYVLSHSVKLNSLEYLGHEIYLEPLLICIVASFVVTNFSRFRIDFHKVIHDASLPIYVAFFTLTGASISIEILMQSWLIAVIFFFIRLVTMIIGSYLGGTLGGDPPKYYKYGWMPYVTQAGVGLGLVTVVGNAFPDWGLQFATILIAVIVLNQLVGPPLFKWVLSYVGESHKRGEPQEYEGHREAYIFGWENQSIALARQLESHGWIPHLVTRRSELQADGIDIKLIEELSQLEFERINANKAEAIVTMLTDEENLLICEIAFEKFGTKDLVVRLNERSNFDKFHELGALIIEANMAMVSLLDHFVRSPMAASLLLGIEGKQDTIDIEVQNEDIHGMALRNIHFPSDVLILSIIRGGNTVISHGYTRLRKGDVVTVVGSKASLENVRLRFE